MSKQIDTNKQIDSSVVVASLATIPTVDLAAVAGGRAAPQGSQNDQGSGGTTMNLSCPSGTTPDYTKISGGVDATVAGGTVKVSGQGSYEHFQCDPLPTTTKKK